MTYQVTRRRSVYSLNNAPHGLLSLSFFISKFFIRWATIREYGRDAIPLRKG